MPARVYHIKLVFGFGQQQKMPVSPTIEHTTRNDDNGVLYLQLPARGKPVENENHRQENQEFERINSHLYKIFGTKTGVYLELFSRCFIFVPAKGTIA